MFLLVIKPLLKPYDGQHKVIMHTGKHFTIDINEDNEAV